VGNDSDFTNLKTLNHRLIQVNFFPLIHNLDYVEGSDHKTRVIDLFFVGRIFDDARQKLMYLHLWKVVCKYHYKLIMN